MYIFLQIIKNELNFMFLWYQDHRADDLIDDKWPQLMRPRAIQEMLLVSLFAIL